MRTLAGVLAVLVFIAVNLSGCVKTVMGYEKDYEGRIVDADTGATLQAAVVQCLWYKETPTVAGSTSSFHEAKETVTDANGYFRLRRLETRAFSNVAPVDLVVFKAGYQHLSASWDLLKEGRATGVTVRWSDNKPTILLKKYTLSERLDRSDDYYLPGVPDAKKRLLLEELRRERCEIYK